MSGTPWKALLVAAEAPVQSGAGLLHLALADHPPLASVGGAVLLARLTRRAVDQLGVVPGRRLWVQVKSVALLETG